MKSKKLLILGGSKYIIPVIKEAHKLGIFVITCDYLPNNYAHNFSDKYVNISVTDKEEVLKFSKKESIDGIISFACDPGVVTAAYVAEKLNLPSCGPLKSVEILQNKNLFREYLKKHGFNVPTFHCYETYDQIIQDKDFIKYPLIVKPVDSAGSKGVGRANSFENLKTCVNNALKFSKTNKIIIEDFIEKDGCSSDCDSLSINGKMVITTFSSQYFDETCPNCYVPSGYYWPPSFKKEQINYLTDEIQRLVTLLGMRTSIYNIETRIGKDGTPYIMELSPRGGGNRLSEMVKKVYGVNLIRRLLQFSVGLPIDKIIKPRKAKNIVEIILHSNKKGIFKSISIDEKIKNNLIEKDVWIKEGDFVEPFFGANYAFGTLVFSFANKKDLIHFLRHQSSLIKVIFK